MSSRNSMASRSVCFGVRWVTKNLLSQAPPCFRGLVKPLDPAAFAVISAHHNPHWDCVMHKEGLCPSSGDDGLMMMTMTMTLCLSQTILFNRRIILRYVIVVLNEQFVNMCYIDTNINLHQKLYLEILRASEVTLSRWFRLHLQFLAYESGLFSLYWSIKEVLLQRWGH
jgi:hypothetical protein